MSDKVPLEAVVQLTRRDVYRANVAIILASKKPWQWVLYLLVQTALGSIMFFALFSLFRGEKASWIALLWGPLFFLLFTPYLWFGAPFFAARSLLRSNPNTAKEVQWLFFPGRIETHGPVSDTTLKWSVFHTIRETDEQFLLYLQKNFANVLPKRSFRSIAEVNAFRELVRSSFAGKIVLRS